MGCIGKANILISIPHQHRKEKFFRSKNYVFIYILEMFLSVCILKLIANSNAINTVRSVELYAPFNRTAWNSYAKQSMEGNWKRENNHLNSKLLKKHFRWKSIWCNVRLVSFENGTVAKNAHSDDSDNFFFE